MGLSKSNSSLIVPYVSAFLTQMSLSVAFIATPILAYMMEAPPFLIGLIGASSGATYAAMTRVFGSIYDRFSRKKLLFASEVIQALSMMVCFFSQDPYQLILSRLVFAFGAALFWPLVIAYVGDLVEADHLGQALAGYNVSWSSATVIGPQLGGLLIVWFSIRTSFLVAFAVLFCTATLLLLGTKTGIERSRHVVHLTKSEKLVRQNSGVFPLIHAFLVAFTAATLSAIFPAYATQLGVPADQIGLMFLLSGLTQTLTVLLANRLQSKLEEGIMLLLSSCFLICSLTMIGFILTVQLFFVGFAIFGLGQGMTYSTAIFSVLKGSSSRRGKTAGVFESTLGIGFFTGPLVGGALYQLSGICPYFFGAFLSLGIIISHLFMKLRRVRTNV
jgi:MFS family permease